MKRELLRIALAVTLIPLASAHAAGPAAAPALPGVPSKFDCESTKEFITAHEYFAAMPDLSLDAQQVMEVSHDISKGCTGAAKRFIRAFEVLLKVELGTRNALRLAVELSRKDDVYAEAFVSVFERAFLKEFLDLDLPTAVQLAQSLSTDFKGDVEQGANDFIELTKFCTDETKVGLSLAECAKMAGEVAKAGENFNKPMAPAYRELYDFLITEDGLHLPVYQAFITAKRVVAVSPEAVKNFISAFRYANSNRGLDMGVKDSLRFAQLMGQRTSQEWAFRDPVNFSRMPAGTVGKPKTKEPSPKQE